MTADRPTADPLPDAALPDAALPDADVARLDAILADVLGLAEGAVTASLSAETAESWDSAAHLRLVLAVEEAFGIELALEEIEAATSRRALLAVVAAKRRGAVP